MAHGEQLVGLVAGQASDEKSTVGIVLDDAFGAEQLERFADRHPARVELLGQLGLAEPHSR